MEKLYMLEVFVTTVVFEELPVPLKKDIVITATCANIGSLEIRTNVMGALENLEAKERSAKNKNFDISCGRSILFPKDSRRMKEVMKNDTLEITVGTTQQVDPIGSIHISWNEYFAEMVESSIETSGYLTPVMVQEDYELLKNGKQTATVSLMIGLTFLGRHVYTNIQKLASKIDSGDPDAAEAFLFKSVDNATIFKCERHGAGSDHDIMPVAPIYNFVSSNIRAQPMGMGAPLGGKGGKAAKSTETILAFTSKGVSSTTSVCQSTFLGMSTMNMSSMAQQMLAGGSTASFMPVTTTTRGPNYLDLTNLKMDASTFSMLASAMGMHVYREYSSSFGEGEGEGHGFNPLFVDYKALTVAEIEARLCKHPDCPAAKKFKEFGIGPLAKGISGLGGMYNDVEAPCAYGLSHCNGTIDDYGPLGRFKRPKKAEDPFVPQSDCKCARKSPSVTSKASKASNTSSQNKGKSACYSHCPVNPMKLAKKSPLRLKGGAPPVANCETVPNPFTLCQDLMDEFNKVLKDYKEALGPCGQATCPFALSVVNDHCYEICNSADPEYQERVCNLANEEAKMVETDDFTGCGVPNCPYKRAAISPAEREFSKYKSMPGCGFTGCPFVKAKLGMEPDEDNHLPPFKDYQKQETYKFSDGLPPIHWDCPEPLPKGDCKNPDCPFVKRDALIKKYFPEPCCPCGNPACPYVTAPCAFPGCPFGVAEPCPPVCPYTEPPPKELKCTPSVCPFVRNTEQRCDNPSCPYRVYEEKMAECARWERQQAILAEQEEEEEEPDEPCKPCGRGRSTRARCSKTKDVGEEASTVPATQTTRTSVTNMSSLDNTDDACILSAAANKGEKGDPCTPKTCGGEVCGICKTHSSSHTKPDAKMLKTENASQEMTTKAKLSGPNRVAIGTTTIERSSDTKAKETTPSPVAPISHEKPTKRFKAVAPPVRYNKKTTMGPLGPITTKCRTIPFRYDRKSFKPCTKIGHRECVLPKFLVPKCMGWLWNIHEDICGLRPRRGWKPGAVSKMLAFRMDYFNALREKRPFGLKPKEGILVAKPSQPTVHINKKAGIVNVTMLPVKDPVDVQKAGDGNPYLDVTPIQFKITKKNPEKDLKYCYCGDPISESESSELDIEYSPPAALPNPRLMHKATYAEEEAQYNINDVPLPEVKKKGVGTLWSYMILRLRGGGCETRRVENEVSTQTPSVADEEPRPRRNTRQEMRPMPSVSTSLWQRILSWRISDDSLSFRVLFLTVNVNFMEDISEVPVGNNYILDYYPVLRLRGGTKNSRLRAGSDVPDKSKKRQKQPPKITLPNAKEMCKDLMDEFDQLMQDYKNTLGPCGTAICPLSYNVREDQCKKICEDKVCPEPYCPPKVGPCMKPICSHIQTLGNVEEEDEDDDADDNFKRMQACYQSCVADQPDGSPAKPCGRSVCPFSQLVAEVECPWDCAEYEDCMDICALATEAEAEPGPSARIDPLGKEIKCNKHICPYKKPELTIDDVNPYNRNSIKSRKGCGSPFCPHSNKFQVEPEVVLPSFPCKKPCPSLEDLPPIHWDCPDPLPQGECTNPFCPFKEKLPCGHCPIDDRHCGMPGCQFAGESLCPPTCPYTQKKPPKDLECTPSICPLIRPADYVPHTIIPRKDRPCHGQCPYATGVTKKSCENPLCPYQTCIDTAGGNAGKDCGNPCCPYRIAAKKLEQRAKERAAKKEKKELEGTFIPICEENIKRQSSDPDQVNKLPTANKLDSKPDFIKKNLRKSAGNLRKLIMSAPSLTADGLNNNTPAENVCKEISCSQFLGDKVCRKCKKRQAEAKAQASDPQNADAEQKKAVKRPSSKKKKSKKKKTRGYVYDKGTYYPGVKFGHKDCGVGARRVPWDMGWKWNITPVYTQLKTRPGWRPGAIGKTMLKFINKERKKLGLPPRSMVKDPLPKRHSLEDVNITISHRSRTKMTHATSFKPKPTLTVKKKNGVIFVTMNPLKDPEMMQDNEYPYIDCSPLEFKITKKKPDSDFIKCLCTSDNPDGESLSNASSVLDIEYTPPAGIVRPELMAKNKHFCNTEAQYDQNDIPSEKKKKGGKKDKKGKKGKKGKGKKGKKGKK